MNILRQIRWKLTLSYTLVTVGAFLVILLITAGFLFTQIFLPNDYFSPERLEEIIRENSTPLWSHVLSQSPVDRDLIKQLLNNSDPTITSSDFLHLGSMKFSVRTSAFVRGARHWG